MYCFLFLQNNNLSVRTVKSDGEETLNCLQVLQSRSKRNKTQCAKLLTDVSDPAPAKLSNTQTQCAANIIAKDTHYTEDRYH